MKRCPKCNRTFPDENQKFCTVDGGLLIAAPPAFDPNATIRATSAELGMNNPDRATSRELPDLNPTMTAASAPTAVFPRNTAPTGPTVAPDVPPQPPPSRTTGPQTPIPSAAPPETHRATPPKKKSKLPWILGGLLVLFLLILGGAVGAFFLVIKPRLAEFSERTQVSQPPPVEETNRTVASENTNTAVAEPSTEVVEFIPPDGTVKFENSKEQLDGRLADQYFDFSFYYPETWIKDAKAGVAGATNFAKVERRIPPDFTQENFAVSWYESKGTYEADEQVFPTLVQKLSETFSTNFPEYRKISEGPTKVNSLDGYEFRFTALSRGTEKGDLQIWGRVVFLPLGDPNETTGATLVMLSTSLAPELSGVEDVGEKGEMPVVLESFRFGKR
ncbi:MAG TPA: hypothetical protein VJ023_17325 [Pyrinomonadaceae bacterium]|nr:hypothetical protein [Pyrinomonadaceae bacterium]